MLAYQQTTTHLTPTTDQPKLPSNDVLAHMSNKVQEQLNLAVEKLVVISKWTNDINTNGLKARQLLRQYQDTVWPLLIEADERLKELSVYLRQCIDLCSFKDDRLEVLLALNRKHVECSKICADLSGTLHAELESVLELRARAARFIGIQLNSNTTDKLDEMRGQLDKMSA